MQRHCHGAEQVVAAALKARVLQLAQLIHQVARRQVRLCHGILPLTTVGMQEGLAILWEHKQTY